MPEELHLHDYVIDKIELDFDNEISKLYCTFEDKITKTEVIFKGFLASKLTDIQPGSIILDLEKWDIDSFIKVEKKYLESRQKYGWPFPTKDIDELKTKLSNGGYSVWWLSPSFGMGGYIIAKSAKAIS